MAAKSFHTIPAQRDLKNSKPVELDGDARPVSEIIQIGWISIAGSEGEIVRRSARPLDGGRKQSRGCARGLPQSGFTDERDGHRMLSQRSGDAHSHDAAAGNYGVGAVSGR